MELLLLIADVGLPESLPAGIDRAARAALEREIDATALSHNARPRFLHRLARRSVLLPVALLFTTAVAAAATGVVTGVINLDQAAQHNAADTPLRLFRADLPAKSGATPTSLWRQTPIPSSVRMIATPTIPGVGTVQYWVADTVQHGICTAIRLPDGSWAGLKDFKQVGGSLVGCRPTRAQIGRGTLILSGFDYTNSETLTNSGQELVLDYGEITAPGQPTEVRDTYSGATTPVIAGKYFLLVTHPVRTPNGGIDVGDDTTIVALNSSHKIIANEHKPLSGTPTTKCVGRYNVHRVRIPGTKRTALEWSCRRYVRTIAK